MVPGPPQSTGAALRADILGATRQLHHWSTGAALWTAPIPEGEAWQYE